MATAPKSRGRVPHCAESLIDSAPSSVRRPKEYVQLDAAESRFPYDLPLIVDRKRAGKLGTGWQTEVLHPVREGPDEGMCLRVARDVPLTHDLTAVIDVSRQRARAAGNVPKLLCSVRFSPQECVATIRTLRPSHHLASLIDADGQCGLDGGKETHIAHAFAESPDEAMLLP